MRIAYVVSRFPHLSETFIAREVEAVDAQAGIEVELFSLFPPRAGGAVHPVAEPWLPRLHRPRPREAIAALGWWLRRRPLRLLNSTARIALAYAHRPSLLARALATIPIAASHARHLEEEPVDHVHAHYATYPTNCAWLCKRLTGTPYSFTAHAHDIFVDQSFLATKVADASFVVAISEYNRRFLRAFGGDSASPVHVVHCGIDPAAFPFEPRPAASEGQVRAACVASLQEYKGHATLLRALAGSDPALARLRVELAGDGPLRRGLERQAAELGVADRVVFRGGLTESEVRELLAASSLFVLPSVIAADGQMEGLPVSLIEALACGLLVVTTRLSGIPELIHDGESGLLAEPGDAAGLGQALIQALRGAAIDPLVGRREVEREFDLRKTSARLIELFAASVMTNE